MALVPVPLISKFAKWRQPHSLITFSSLETIPEPVNIASDRGLKTKMQNTIEEELMTL